MLLVAFVLTFLGASIFNIAAGEPFNPAQVLWIHFVVNAPFGFALGFDQETPGLMARRPRPRGHSVLTRPVLVTVGLVGLAITVGLLSLIKLGESQFGSVAGRLIDRVHRVRALPDRGRLRVPQRDRVGAHHRRRSTASR